MELRALASTYSFLTHTINLWVGLKGKKYSECGHVAYQIKKKEVKTNVDEKNFDLTHISDLWVRLKSDIESVQISLFLLN